MASTSDLLRAASDGIGAVDVAAVEAAVAVLGACAARGNQVWLAGNGGSSSTASHLAGDLAKWGSPAGVPPVRATCLNDNVTLLSALTNDIGWEEVYSYQLARRAVPGDVFIAFSVHGGAGREIAGDWSQNLVRAIGTARAAQCATIGVSGYDGGVFGDICDVHLWVQVDSTPVVESVHLLLAHAIAEGLRLRPPVGGSLE